MHFAAEDYGHHELMNWGLCRFAPLSGTTPKNHDTLYGRFSTAEICRQDVRRRTPKRHDLDAQIR